ncbi:MAG: hypothetical protein AAF740_07135, partial [Bacteroidota bacterium]
LEDIRYLKVNKKHKFSVHAVVLEDGESRRNKLKNLVVIDKNRTAIGIGTYDEYVRKIIFQADQGEFYFGIKDGIIKL